MNTFKTLFASLLLSLALLGNAFANEKVNINTASAEELDGLPGIGPVLAQRIVDEREANGPYTGAEDLTRVEGIGQAIVESIQDHIITEDTQE